MRAADNINESIKCVDRFPGPKPYQEYEQDLFFGRNTEIQDLYNAVSVHTMIIVHGESGLGKSSLINAGLIPRLKSDGYLPVSLRFKERKKTPTESIISDISSITSNIGINTLINDDYKLWYQLKMLNMHHKKVVLVFDQFEEFFLFRAEERKEMLRQLSNAMLPLIPDFFKEQIKENISAYTGKLWVPHYLRHEKNIAGVDSGNDAQQAAGLPNIWFMHHEIKCIFSLRSDKLALLEDLSVTFPGIMKNRYQVRPIRAEHARQLIYLPSLLEPISYIKFNTRPFNIENSTIDDIIKVVKDEGKESIETTQLQMICQEIEAFVAQQQNKEEPGKTTIGSSQFNYEKLRRIVTEFYSRQLKKIRDKQWITDADYLSIRVLIEKRFIAQNVRVPLTKESIIQHCSDFYNNLNNKSKEDPQTIELKKIDDIIDMLLELRIIRDQPYGNSTFYEISHDTIKEGINLEMIKREEEEKRNIANEELRKKQREIETKNKQIQEIQNAREEAEKAKELAVNSLRALNQTRIRFRVMTTTLVSIALALFGCSFWLYLSFERRKANDIIVEANKLFSSGKHYLAFRKLTERKLIFIRDTFDKSLQSYNFAEVAGQSFSFSPDNDVVYSRYNDSTGDVWAIDGNKPKLLLDIHGNIDMFSSKGAFLIGSENDSSFYVMNTKNKSIIIREDKTDDLYHSFYGFSPSENYFWLSSPNRTLIKNLRNNHDDAFVTSINSQGHFTKLTFTSDDHYCLINYNNSRAKLFDLLSSKFINVHADSILTILSKYPYLIVSNKHKLGIYDYVKDSLYNYPVIDTGNIIRYDEINSCITFWTPKQGLSPRQSLSQIRRGRFAFKLNSYIDLSTLELTKLPDSSRYKYQSGIIYSPVGRDSAAFYHIPLKKQFVLDSIYDIRTFIYSGLVNNSMYYYDSLAHLHSYNVVNGMKKTYFIGINAGSYAITPDEKTVFFTDYTSNKLMEYDLLNRKLDSFNIKGNILGFKKSYLEIEVSATDNNNDDFDSKQILLIQPQPLKLTGQERIRYLRSIYPVKK